MFARIEVGMRPEFADPAALAFLRRLELAHPEVRAKIRWARLLDIFWLDVPLPREEVISASNEIFWDPVLQWLFTGNLIPSAAGKHGGLMDLMEAAPHRPGKFWALERRFRPGVTDNVGRTTREAFEIVLNRKIPDGRTSSGALLMLEGPELSEDILATIARGVFCNELIETWTLYQEDELRKNDRFHQERVKRDLPKTVLKSSSKVENVSLAGLDDGALEAMSRERLWALTLDEMQAVRDHFSSPAEIEKRGAAGVVNNPGEMTDVEMEVIAQTWSEHCKHKIFNARIRYEDSTEHRNGIPGEIPSLFKETISGTTAQIQRPWLLSVFEDNAGIVEFDEENAFCIKVETHNSPSALDPYGGALTGIVGVNRDILGCGLGAKPIFNTDVFCLAPPNYSESLPERILHPRRILDGVRRGVEHGGNKSGIPTINGALVFDERYLGKPLIYCGTGGFMPKKSAGRDCHVKEVKPGDRICMVGGRIGKDGIHGATFSSLALDQYSPASAVQLGDPITQKRMADFLLEARELGLYRAITDNGAGGLSSSVGEMARLSGGARMDVGRALTKYPGLRPFELVVSESQERMTIAVPQSTLGDLRALAERRNVEISDLGEFTESGYFEILHEGKPVAHLNLEFLHKGVPELQIDAKWTGRPPRPPKSGDRTFLNDGPRVLSDLLGRPNIASKEWLIRQYDHEVQGTSVIKPLHVAGLLTGGAAAAVSGPNDGGVIKPTLSSISGIAIGCGINPKLSDVDPYIMAQSAVDEAVRNVLCVGAEYGMPESVLALVDNFCWPDPVKNPEKAAALVRAAYGMRDAALGLGAPFVSGKDSMKNDYRGRLDGKDVEISVVPTLLVTAVARVPDIRWTRTADFKSAGDIIYLFGGTKFGLIGSEFQSMLPGPLPCEATLAEPDWQLARNTYSWIGGSAGKGQHRLRSLHDVSDGGVLVSVAESLIARGLGAQIEFPVDANPWEFGFGEGFHGMICSVIENDALQVESEWTATGISFLKLGVVTSSERLDVAWTESGARKSWNIQTRSLRFAWKKEGYWE